MTEERIEGRYIHTTSLAYRERGERPAGSNEFDCPDLKVIFNENHPQYKEQYYNLWRKKYYATTPSGEPLPPRLTHPLASESSNKSPARFVGCSARDVFILPL